MSENGPSEDGAPKGDGAESPSASSPPSMPPTTPPEGPLLTVDLERGGEMSDVEYRELRKSTGGE